MPYWRTVTAPPPLSELTRAWLSETFDAPTEVQRAGWKTIAGGEHALLIAPTGSGKTLAAFLYAIDRLCDPRGPHASGKAGVRVLYVSPLKALVHDIERNLRLPLAGLASLAERRGDAFVRPTVAIRTGDTTAKERRQQLRQPPDILVTTPESLYLLLGSQARENLRSVHTVIVDEVHALAPEKRGAHLALSLERLSVLADRDPQRVGLSATARPVGEVARFLGGSRPVTIVDTSQRPDIELSIHVPVRDMTRPVEDPQLEPSAQPEGQRANTRDRGMWAVIHPQLLELIRRHRTTILFVNSRGLCERLCRRLNELAGEELVRSHHGSLAHHERTLVEEQLKAGEIRGIVATSSLELGIDMGTVDLVVMVESPSSVASGLQRVGRAGHGVGETSRGMMYPKHRHDLLQGTVVAQRMAEGAIEALTVPDNPLDVLAQQIVAMVSVDELTVAQVTDVVTAAASYRELPDDALHGVLDMLAGRYPSHQLSDLRPRIVWDRDSGKLTPRKGAKMLAIINGGTIPDRGTYAVHLGEDGPRLGELDEEMVYESAAGEVFTLGASSWRIERITRDRVIVAPAPGEPGRLPFWHGQGPGRPLEVGMAIGAFTREVGALSEPDAVARLTAQHGLDALAARNLLDYLGAQRETTGGLPTDRAITIECFPDELGDHRLCILSPFGARVHAPWALCIEAQLSGESGFDVQAVASDDGIVLRIADGDELPSTEALLPEPESIEDLILPRLAESALFAGQFRQNAARALLLPRRRPGARAPLWLQRRRSSELLAVALQFPAFPIIMETYRACLRDIFDVPALAEVLSAIRSREIRVERVHTRGPSPFAQSLVFEYTASFLYDGDAPLAERRAQALSLDRGLLRELLGERALRDLLDAQVIEAVEAELQGTAESRRAGDVDGLHHLLMRVGALTAGEVAQRVECPPQPLLAALVEAGRVVPMQVGGESRHVCVEDVGLYRDALGCRPPDGVAAAFLEPVDAPVDALIGRHARTRGPFTVAQFAARHALPPAQAEALLRAHVDRGTLVAGEFLPGGSGPELCDPEVLRRIKRRTFAKLRDAVAPTDVSALGRFLPAWHGVGGGVPGLARLQEVVVQLEGLPLSFVELERSVLPARVPDFRPAMLDELGATGFLVWVGHGGPGTRDGKVALYRRSEAARLVTAASVEALADALGHVHRAVLERLQQGGASFFAQLRDAAAPAGQNDVLAALRDLVWMGLVTNDTFEPLRRIGVKPASGGARSQRGARAQARALSRAVGGRWSLVAELCTGGTDTERAHAIARGLLERHGLVARETVAIEATPGGFATVYPVLRAMEEAGTVRRGYFVEGLGGAQFASPGAVDRLRRAAEARGRDAVLLSAVDPANPYGWLLPWPGPGPGDDAARAGQSPRRASGAFVVLVGGEPVLYLGKGHKHLLTFPAARDGDVLRAALPSLERVAAARRGRQLHLETIDGAPARTSTLAAQLLRGNFAESYRGLSLELAR